MVSVAELKAQSGTIFQRRVRIPTKQVQCDYGLETQSASYTFDQIQQIMQEVCQEGYYTIPYFFYSPYLLLGSHGRYYRSETTNTRVFDYGDFILVGNTQNHPQELIWPPGRLRQWSDFSVFDMYAGGGQDVHARIIERLNAVTDQLELAFRAAAGSRYS